ncbi:MAG: hypothetical protein MK175_08855 [Pseudoalteromonas sp.]|uniref:hypothetical protein n=1 Tax=Pseudoalteromonas sp. TaxID=53249 RepID=UPI0025CE6628|nr:hypothetical protein [Pseudoalteromonas sp.]MCH2087281.1 hypothetical protein [Pseudoalteromonas sp.]
MNNSAAIVSQKKGIVLKGTSSKVSKDGYSFDINSNKWHLNKDVVIRFQADVLELDPITQNGFRESLARYAEEASASHTLNMYMRFQRMVRDTRCKTIDEYVIRNWRAMLDNEHEWYLGALRGFLISWYDYGYKGISSEVVKVLEGMTLSGNQKGIAIANRCPYTGALTQHEQIAVANELIRMFSEDQISLACYSYLVTLQATARRSVQLRQLKIVDLIKEPCSKTKTTNYYLNIPRAKQRGVGFREVFKKLAITEELYLTLLNLAESESNKLGEIFNIELNDKQKVLVPVFIDWSKVREMVNHNLSNDALEQLLTTDLFHLFKPINRWLY